MRKIFLFIVILLLFFSPRIYWFFKPTTVIDAVIIDKTVPHDDYREHNGLFWLLTNEKLVQTNEELYDIEHDYFGYDPHEQKPMDQYNIQHYVDLIYIADTYGVYSDDLELAYDGERSQKLYGGMELQEWQAVMASKGPETMLIAEYNSFATPTAHDTRNVMEQDLNVTWSGWTARYFNDLNSDEVPPWLMTNYETQYNKKWLFEGAGIAFVHLNDQVVVLSKDVLKSDVQFQLTSSGKVKFPKAMNTNYPYWFDIVKPGAEADVYATYELSLEKEALDELERAGIPTDFPAIIHHRNYNTYYFAGDYADYTKQNLMKWQRSDIFMNIFSNEESNFFWASYVPIMRVLFQDITK